MAPFVVMIGALLLFRGLGALGVHFLMTWQDCARYTLAVLFLFTAGSRLTPMKAAYVRAYGP
jgi:hypothetical protein